MRVFNTRGGGVVLKDEEGVEISDVVCSSCGDDLTNFSQPL